MSDATKRTAVLVIRAWFEGDDERNSLRFRITSTLDVTAPRVTNTLGAASEEDVLQAVRAWLRALVSGS
jgi:hypothetical protein